MNEIELTLMGTWEHIEGFLQELHISRDGWKVQERAELYLTASDYYKEKLVAKQKKDGSVKLAYKTKIPVYSNVLMEYREEKKKKFYQLVRVGISFNCLMFKKKQSMNTALFEMPCKIVVDTVYPVEYKGEQGFSFHQPFYHVEIELIGKPCHEKRLGFFEKLEPCLTKFHLEMVTNETSKYKLSSTRSQFLIIDTEEDLNLFFQKVFLAMKNNKQILEMQ